MILLPDLSEFQPNADMAGIRHANGGAVTSRAAAARAALHAPKGDPP